MVMSLIGWLVLGLVAGLIASKLMNKRGEGLPRGHSCSALWVRWWADGFSGRLELLA